jgi:hypothetical protein
MGPAHLESQKGWIAAAVSHQERERPMVSLRAKAIVLMESLAQSKLVGLSAPAGVLHSMTAPPALRASERLSSMCPA